MATGVAPMARIDSCQIGAGGVLILNPARSEGFLMGLLVTICLNPWTHMKERILKPWVFSSSAFQPRTEGSVFSFWTSSRLSTK